MSSDTLGTLTARIIGKDRDVGPVVVLCHGFGAPGDDLVSLAGEIAAPPGTRFVFPAAPLMLEQGYFESRAWWMIDMERLERAIVTGEIRDITREHPVGLPDANLALNSVLDAVEKRFDVTGDRIVLGGFSQGAMLACDVALQSDRKLAGLLLMSGTLLAEDLWLPRFATRKGLPVVQSHGTMDPILPYVIAEKLRELMVAAGLAHTWVPFQGGHQVPRGVIDAAGVLLAGVQRNTARL